MPEAEDNKNIQNLLEEYRVLSVEIARLFQLRDTTFGLAVSAVGVILGLGKAQLNTGVTAILVVIATAVFITWTCSYKAWSIGAYLSVFVEEDVPGLRWNTVLIRTPFKESGPTGLFGIGWIRRYLLFHAYPFGYLLLATFAYTQGIRNALQGHCLWLGLLFTIGYLFILYWILMLQDSNSAQRYAVFIEHWKGVKMQTKGDI